MVTALRVSQEIELNRESLETMMSLLRERRYFDLLIRFCTRFIPSRLLYFGKFYLYDLLSEPFSKQCPPEGGSFRRAGLEDLSGILACSSNLGNERRESLYLQRFNNGSICNIVEYEFEIVGHQWVYPASYSIVFDDHRKTTIDVCGDENIAFGGDGWIHPKYRMKGLYQALCLWIINQLKQNNFQHYYLYIASYNDRAIKSARQIGGIKMIDHYIVICLGYLYALIIYNKRKHLFKISNKSCLNNLSLIYSLRR